MPTETIKQKSQRKAQQEQQNELDELLPKTVIAVLILFAFIAFLIAINK